MDALQTLVYLWMLKLMVYVHRICTHCSNYKELYSDIMSTTEEAKKKHAAFVAKREQHYSEYKVLQAMREKHLLDEDDDDVS